MSNVDGAVIKKASKNDVKDIFNLEQRCFERDAFSKRQFSYLVSKANSEFVVVLQGNKIIAYLIILKRKNSKQFRIYSIAIEAEARGLGIGRMLLEYVEKTAKKENIKKISLEVSEKNSVAINLYKSQDYTLISRKENYYADGSAALVMLKKL